jgi:hypothetical protein
MIEVAMKDSKTGLVWKNNGSYSELIYIPDLLSPKVCRRHWYVQHDASAKCGYRLVEVGPMPPKQQETELPAYPRLVVILAAVLMTVGFAGYKSTAMAMTINKRKLPAKVMKHICAIYQNVNKDHNEKIMGRSVEHNLSTMNLHNEHIKSIDNLNASLSVENDAEIKII